MLARLTFVEGAGELRPFADCGIVIEAIVERLDVKRALFASLESVVADDAVLATNTSSLPVAAIGGGCRRSDRVLGVHFFNPAPVMPLVEIVPSLATSPDVTSTTRALVDSWRKTTVMASDTPGFIVNRVARPYYGEAIRMLRGRHRRHRHDRLGDEIGRWVPHGSVRAHGLHRARRELRRHAQCVRGHVVRSAVPAIRHAATARRCGWLGRKTGPRFLRLLVRRRRACSDGRSRARPVASSTARSRCS